MTRALCNLSTYDDPVYPDVEKMLAERRELFRLAGCNALARSRNGRDLDPEARAWAHRMAAVAPLGRAMTEGEQ